MTFAPSAPALSGIVPSPEPLPFTHVRSGRAGLVGRQTSPAPPVAAGKAAVKLPSIKGRPVGHVRSAEDDSPCAPVHAGARPRRRKSEERFKAPAEASRSPELEPLQECQGRARRRGRRSSDFELGKERTTTVLLDENFAQDKLVYVKKSGFDGKKHAASVDSKKAATSIASLEDSPRQLQAAHGAPKPPTRLRLLGGSVATRTERLASFSQGAVRIANDAACRLRPRFFSHGQGKGNEATMAASAREFHHSSELEDPVQIEEESMPVEAIDSSQLPFEVQTVAAEPAWQEEQRKLQEALALLRSGAEPAEPSAQQVAETKELQDVLSSRELHDRQALAYCLVFKLGSLDNAFAYLNCFGSDHFVKVTWETALLVLHIEVFKLTGLSRHQIFRDMSEGSDKVCKELWDGYFAGIDVEGVWEGRKAAERKSKAPRPRKARAPEAAEEPSEVAAKEEVSGSAVAEEPPSPVAPPAPEGGVPAETVEEEAPSLPSLQRRASGADKMRRAAQLAMASRRFQKKGGKGVAGTTAEGSPGEKVEKSRSVKRRVSTEKFSTGNEDVPPVEEREDDEVFLARVTKLLEELPPDREAFIDCSSRQQKSLLLEAARERDYFASAWKSGVLVVNEGEEARKLRNAVASVGCGFTRLKAPKQLESFGRSLTEDAGMTVLETEDCFEGGQMAVLMDVLQDRGTPEELEEAAEGLLSGLAEGEIKSFALAAQSQFRAALIKVAAAKGMEMAAGDGSLQIGNLQIFDDSVKATIEGLEEGASHVFGMLHNLKKQIVRKRSRAAGMVMDEPDGMVRIQRLTNSPTFNDKASALEELRKVTDAAFKRFATGRLGHQIFMRRQDLAKLLEDTQYEDRFELLRARVDQVYDDTLQLQLDILGQNYGLSKEYFQVFLTKASNELGWRPNMDALLAMEQKMEDPESGNEDELE